MESERAGKSAEGNAGQGNAGQGSAGHDALKQALDRLWLQFQPMMRERVAILEASAAGANGLSGEEREAAHGAAHKLAGALGTFGLAEGTALAREAEAIYTGDMGGGDRQLAEESVARLSEIAAQLRVMIEGRG